MNNPAENRGAIPHNNGGIRIQGTPICTRLVEKTVGCIRGLFLCGEDGDVMEDGSVRCPVCAEEDHLASSSCLWRKEATE